MMPNSRMTGAATSTPWHLLMPGLLFLLFLPGYLATAQSESILSTTLVDQRLDALRESGSASDSEIVTTYEAVKSLLVEAESHQRDAAQYLEAMTTAPQREAEIQARMDARDEEVAVEAGLDDLERSELEARLVVLRTDLGEATNNLDALDRRLAARETDANAIRSRLGEIAALVEAAPDIAPAADPTAQPSLAEAQQWRDAARYLALGSERRALEARLTSQPVRHSAMGVERAEVALNVDKLSQQVRQLEDHLQAQVADAVDAQSLGIEADDPAFALADDLAAQDAALRSEWITLNENLARARRQIEEIDRQSRALGDQFATARRVVDFAAGSEVLGRVLLAYWGEMDDFRLAAPTGDLSRQAGGAVIRRIQLEDILQELSGAKAYIDRLLQNEGIEPDNVPGASRTALVELVSTYRDRLRATISAESDYIEALSALGAGYEALSRQIRGYEDYLKGLILWIPAYPPLWEIDKEALPHELDALGEQFRSIRFSLQPTFLVCLALFAFLLSQRARLIAYQDTLNGRISRPRDDSMRYTLLALVCVALRALPVPLLVAGIAAALSDELTTRISMTFAIALFVLQSTRLICAPTGVGLVHFGWPESRVEHIHRELGWLIYCLLPVAAITGWIMHATEGIGEAVITRVAMVIVLLIPLILITVTLSRYARGSNSAWLRDRSHQIRLLLIAVLATITLAVLFGHVFSVTVIFNGVVDTAWIGISLLLLYSILMRWVKVIRRRLRLAEIIEARTEQVSPEDSLMEEQTENLVEVSEETSQLITVGIIATAAISLVYIWSPLLPAFDAFTRVTLWTSTSVVEGQSIETRITLATLLIVLFLAGLTLYAASRLPALIDLVLRSRTRVSASARYTTSTLVNYVIIFTGIVAASSALGLQWSKLQWLVAALGVGIGFGLQEIIANFISGLIILFERPIRVGDVISTGGNDGVVTRIRIRATTIRDWDGKELLVPNKEFITSRLLNWSLSDPKVRVVLPVGIAYGSDVELAIKTLYDIVATHSRVVDDPPPGVVFESFGDNALMLSARCYLDSLDNRLGVVTEMNREIYRRFGELDIVIAFPQRDIHFDAEKPIRIALDKPSD